jgi:hypothetical protein
MQMQKVLVRAFGGEPLDRVVVEHGERVIFLAHPGRIAAVQAGDSYPVGFPREDVFVFDAALYERLKYQWDSQGLTESALWAEATCYGAVPASRA